MVVVEGRPVGEFTGGFEFVLAPVAPDSLDEGFATAAPAPGRPPQSVEHEARGLLNVVMLLTRCLELGPMPAERAAWVREIEAADQRLEQLYAAGLDRHFDKQS